MRRKKFSVKLLLIGIAVFVAVFGVTFLGVQWFTKTGIFRVLGVVYFDESLSDAENAKLNEIFTEEVNLDEDVTISARYELELPELSSHEFLTEILVPVTDFYSIETDINSTDVEVMLEPNTMYQLISVDDLSFGEKLLSIDGNYYLDNFTTGGIYRILSFESELYEEEIEPLVAETFRRDWPTKDTVLTFAQTGVTALSRVMNAKLNQVGDATYFAKKIGPFLSSFDLTHTSNESSFVNYAPSSGSTGTAICSDQRFIGTLLAIGLDIVELTGNHNQDCGDEAARDAIDTYKENGILIVGGGKTADEAAKPLLIDEKGTAITMLAFNQSTGGATYDNTPGANQYYEEVAATQIAEAKARGDFVIVDVQYYECNMYASTYEDPICDYANSAAGDQVGLFRHLIELGADVVVGTAAHQPQTFELYKDGAIYYGLGNLFFDQYRWPGTTRSLVLAHYFYDGKLLQTKIVPTVYDADFQTELMDEETTKWYLARLTSARP